MSISKKGWQLFDKIYCLNQDSRPDRWEQAKSEFERVGVKVDRFATIPADQPNKSFCLSQYAMLKTFLQTDGRTLLTFEDDVLFKDMPHLQASMEELPIDWDIIYLGANITDMVFGIKENPPVRYSDHLFRVCKAWTTHAIGYTRAMVERIVAEYPVHTFEMYDNWLNSEILPTFNAYLVNPMVCWQRPGKSDLWGQETDYTGAFIHGDKIMSV
jgi:GR25 family glycosyltransferase involved in LPS biosynthesis